MKNILFIGAGASFGARLACQLPLGNNLLQWMKSRCEYLLNTLEESGFVFGQYRRYANEIRSIIKDNEDILAEGSCGHKHFGKSI